MPTKKIVLLAAWLLPTAALAAGGVPLDDAGTDIHNDASLQRGARNFVNYCLGCHSINTQKKCMEGRTDFHSWN